MNGDRARIVINDVVYPNDRTHENGQNLSTQLVLSHCKKKILLPYLRVLAAMGLRSLNEPVLSALFLTMVITVIFSGYILQYMTCYRRDLGFRISQVGDEMKCPNSFIYSHLVPSLLHLAGYLQALLTLRVRETERLETLMERTFLLAAHQSTGLTTIRNLVRNLWLCVACSVVWVLVSVILLIFMLCSENVLVQWTHPSTMDSAADGDLWKIAVRILLVVCTLWHDMLQATIVASYCLQVLLLSYSVALLRSKLLQHTFQPLEWLREVSECQQSISYLNKDLAPAVSVLCLLNVSWAGAGIFTVVKQGNEIDAVSWAIVFLWAAIAVAPVAAAAHLTSSCSSLRGLGHQVRPRPFVYQSTPAGDLDTLLLFTSSLRMRAKLCGLPIMPKHVFLIITSVFISLLILGQCRIL